MHLLKTALLIVAVIAVLPGIANGQSDQCSELPTIKQIDKRSFCPRDGKNYGHTLVILDLTPSVELEQAQIDSIKEKVFSEDFFKKYQPFTKFSYVLINRERPQSQQPYLAMCRPKTGDKNRDFCDQVNEWRESKRHVRKRWKQFVGESKKVSEEVFKNPQGANNSLIYETIISVFKFPKFDFGNDYPKRDLVIVSDMLQHSKRLSFYTSCRSRKSKVPDRCPKLDKVLTPSVRKYIEATSGGPETYDGVNIEVVLLHSSSEASPDLAPSLRSLWKEFFGEFFGKKDVRFDIPLDIY